MHKVNIYEAKAKFSKLISEVENEKTTVIICRNGKPVADLVYHKNTQDPLKQNKKLSGAKYLCDPCSGVDNDDWPEDLR
jgi:prevent-host-death family protein